MWRVPIGKLGGWKRERSGQHDFALPTAATITCPGCRVPNGFSFSPTIKSVLLLSGTTAGCPTCGAVCRFWVLDPNNDRSQWTGTVWVDPDPPQRPRLDVSGIFSAGLAESYHEAIDLYDHGKWRSAAQLARTVMEGAVATKLGEKRDRRNLYTLLEALKKDVDLAAPINEVGHLVRDGGNFASHFDEDRTVTPEFASEVLDLLDAFVEYLLLLPARTSRLAELLGEET